jgi:hypothetical protein
MLGNVLTSFIVLLFFFSRLHTIGISAHNDELVNLLMERDALSMEQDSILVDIEDLTK